MYRRKILSRIYKDIQKVPNMGDFNFRGKKWHFEKYPLGIFLKGTDDSGKNDKVCFYPSIPKIPERILQEIIRYFRKDLQQEMVVQILFMNNEFLINLPHIQYSTKVSVSYCFQIPVGALLVVTIHSHNTMPAFFSDTDDKDEEMPGLYGVVGCLDRSPQLKLRASVDGSFGYISVWKLFYKKEDVTALRDDIVIPDAEQRSV